jgi:transcriptional regulator with XRE-family HTH domain
MMSNRLREVRQGRGWSQARLIHALQQQADLVGINVAAPASLKTQLSRWENGHCLPDQIYRALFCAVYAMTELDLGLTSLANDSLRELGLTYAETWSEGVVEVTKLWQQDVNRRCMLKGSAFAAAAYGMPAFRWLMSDTDEQPARLLGVKAVRPVDVAGIRQMAATFRSLDNTHGGGYVRDQAVRYLDREVAPLLRDFSYDSRTGIELFRAAAELTQLVGWMAYDDAAHGLSQRYLVQALRLAKAAGDRSLGAEILAAMSHQAAYLGQASSAVDLARAAGRTAREARVPALVAEASVLEAHGHAGRNDARACVSALGEAERTLERADRSSDPQWIAYFDDAYVSAKFGHCFRALGQPKQAERFASRSLDMDPRYVRGRAFNLSLLAVTHAQQGEVEQACAVGGEALDLTSKLDSRRAVNYLVELRTELLPYVGHAAVDSFGRRVDQLVAAA